MGEGLAAEPGWTACSPRRRTFAERGKGRGRGLIVHVRCQAVAVTTSAVGCVVGNRWRTEQGCWWGAVSSPVATAAAPRAGGAAGEPRRVPKRVLLAGVLPLCHAGPAVQPGRPRGPRVPAMSPQQGARPSQKGWEHPPGGSLFEPQSRPPRGGLFAPAASPLGHAETGAGGRPCQRRVNRAQTWPMKMAHFDP